MRYSGLILSFALPLALPFASARAQEGMPKDFVLHDTTGKAVGRVTVSEHRERLQFRVQLRDMPRGIKGMHLHEAGLCQVPGFASAGAHLNPGTMRHGAKNPQGPHLGDLGNITVGGDGRGDRTVDVRGAEARAGMKTFFALGQNGMTLVVHASRDDEQTDPAGNSGARIACAVLGP